MKNRSPAWMAAAVVTTLAQTLLFATLLPRPAVATELAAAVMPPVLTVEYSADRRIESADRTIDGRVAAAPGMEFVARDHSAGGFLWYSADGIPVKMDVLSKDGGDKSRTTVTLQNIKVGPQDRTAFEVPAGFSKLPGGGMFRSSR